MPLIRPDAPPQTLGFIVLQQQPGRLVPMADDKGAMAIFATAQQAHDTAQAIAQNELKPTPDKPVMTAQMKSHVYFVCALQPVAQIQASVKNPEQILRPDVKRN